MSLFDSQYELLMTLSRGPNLVLTVRASWKGLDRGFCYPVTCTKFCNSVAWLMNLNIIWSLDMIILSYISFVVSFCILLRWSSIWYMILILEIWLNISIKIHFYFEILWGVKTLGSNISKTIHLIAMKFTEVT